jgi:hypothetical protein
MSAPGAGLVLASGVQGGHAPTPGYETIIVMVAVAAMVVAIVLIALHLRRRYRRPRPVVNEWQAQAVMGELCPHGWQASITLYGWGAPVPDDAPAARVPQVELEWKQFEEESGRVAVARRVWAPSIGQALETMVEDRRTDITLEQIEQSVSEDDELWWND